MVKVIAVGDPHFRPDNIEEVREFTLKLKELVTEEEPDFVVVLGDVLHTMERVHTVPLNEAYNLVKSLREVCTTYVLVGNHDYINQKQFLTDNHWMNGMKEWENVKIVDRLTEMKYGQFTFLALPYVPPGRFNEALQDIDLTSITAIFAHQEFKGCKMGAIISEKGDEWDIDNPTVISGHIHENQHPQKNIYYPGSSLQHSFTEKDRPVIPIIQWIEGKEINVEEVDLKLPRKYTKKVSISEAYKYTVTSNDKVKLIVECEKEEYETFKKSSAYRALVKNGVRVEGKFIKRETIKYDKVVNGIDDYFQLCKNILLRDGKTELESELKSIVYGYNT